MRRWFWSFVLVLAFPGGAFAQVAGGSGKLPLDSAIKTGKLPNGLRYFIQSHAWPKNRAELRLVVNAGSILEDPDQRGLAHFVEHMAFNGTKHFPKSDIVDYLERIGMRFGADLNAYTAFDETVYMLTLPTDTASVLTQGVEIMSDWAHDVTLDSAAIVAERGVVLEEWRLGRGAQGRIGDKLRPVMMRGSRYAERLPIGDPATIKSASVPGLWRFYRDWYRPDLMTVVAVGDFDPAKMEQMIRDKFGAIAAAKAPRSRPSYTAKPRATAVATIATDPEAVGTGIGVMFYKPTGANGTEASYRAALIGSFYEGMLNERFGEIARRSNPPFIGGGASRGAMVRGLEMFSLNASVKDSSIERGMTALLTEVARVEQHGFLPSELERIKKGFSSGAEARYREREKIESRAIAGALVTHVTEGEAVLSAETEYRMAQRVIPTITLAEVNAAARAYLRSKDRMVLVTANDRVKPFIPSEKSLLALIDRVLKTKVDPYVEESVAGSLMSKDLPLVAITSERYDSAHGITTWVLANGAKVLLKPTTFKADEVGFYGFSAGGLSVEPDSLFMPGRFAITALGVSGIGEFTPGTLGKALAGKRAGLVPFIDDNREGVNGGSSTEDLKTMFELLYLNMLEPRADSAAFATAMEGTRTQLEAGEGTPGQMVNDTFSVALYQNHPRTRSLKPAMLDSVTLARAIGVYRDRFADAGDFTYVMVGSFSLDSVRPLVQRYIGNLPSLKRAERARDVGIATAPGKIEKVVYKGLEQQSVSVFAFTGSAAKSPAEAFLLNSVLPNVVSIRLRESLREGRGGTYSINVQGGYALEPKPTYNMVIQFGSDPERTDELGQALLEELDSLRKFGPTADELAKTKELIVRERESAVTSNGYWLGSIVQAESEQRSLDDVMALDPLLALITADRVKQALNLYFPADRFVRVSLQPETEAPTPSK